MGKSFNRRQPTSDLTTRYLVSCQFSPSIWTVANLRTTWPGTTFRCSIRSDTDSTDRAIKAFALLWLILNKAPAIIIGHSDYYRLKVIKQDPTMRFLRFSSIPQYLCVWSWIKSCHKAPYESSHFKPWPSVWQVSCRGNPQALFSHLLIDGNARLLDNIRSPHQEKQNKVDDIRLKRRGRKRGTHLELPEMNVHHTSQKTINPAIEWSPGLCGPRGARTHDPNIKSVVLYQLS